MRRVEVAVVGAGVTGLSVAYFLRELGVEALVVERTGIAAEASGVQPGGVRQQWGTRVNCVLARESVAFYRDFESAARFDPCGYLFVAHSEELLDELRGNVVLQNEVGVPSRLVSPAEATELVPGLDVEGVAGGAWCAEDGYFDRPQTVVEAFGAGTEIEMAEVRRLERDGAGWRLDDLIAADAVVVAAGVDTTRLVPGVPIEPEARHLFLSEPIRARLLEPLVVAVERRFAAKQLANGRVLASELAAEGERDDWRRHIGAAIHELLPILSFVSFPVLVSGLYDVTPDHQPLIGEVEDNLWLAAGFSGHGFMLAPAVGRRLAGAVAGSPVDDLLDAFAPDRFAHGAVEPERRLV
ncbi:MAG: FAD-binding oxidoreductase [Actinobacteria bacterium]|nr:MAG: FAD-binding oxidoreductase [Actinomycetota bacterium]